MYQYVIDQSNESPDGDIEKAELNKDEPYILDLTFYRYVCEKAGGRFQGYTISKMRLIKTIYIYIEREREWDYQNRG